MRIPFQSIRFHDAGIHKDSLRRSKSIDGDQRHVVNSAVSLSRRRATEGFGDTATCDRQADRNQH